MAIQNVGEGWTSIPNVILRAIADIYKKAVVGLEGNIKTVEPYVVEVLGYDKEEVTSLGEVENRLTSSVFLPISIARESGIEDGIDEFFKDSSVTQDFKDSVKVKILNGEDFIVALDTPNPLTNVKGTKEFTETEKIRLSDMFKLHTPIKVMAKTFEVSETEIQTIIKKMGFTIGKDYSKSLTDEQKYDIEWKIFSEHLKYHRKKREITCDEFSAKIKEMFGIEEGYSRCTLNNWERNIGISKLTFEHIDVLVTVLNSISPLTIYDLFSSKDGFRICMGGKTITELRDEAREKRKEEKKTKLKGEEESVMVKEIKEEKQVATLTPMASQVVAKSKEKEDLKEEELSIPNNSGLSAECIKKVEAMANTNGLTFMETLEAIIETTPITRKFRVKRTYEVED